MSEKKDIHDYTRARCPGWGGGCTEYLAFQDMGLCRGCERAKLRSMVKRVRSIIVETEEAVPAEDGHAHTLREARAYRLMRDIIGKDTK